MVVRAVPKPGFFVGSSASCDDVTGASTGAPMEIPSSL